MLQRAATLLTPTPPSHPDVWGEENRVYPETSGLPGKRNPYLTNYMVPFGRVVHAGTHKRVVGVTAAQSGKTEAILDCIGARIDQRPAPILYVGPSKEFTQDQFEPRLMELLDQAAVLRSRVSRGKRMKKLLKIVNGVRVRLASAGSSTSLKSDPFGLGFVDEYDEMMGNIKGQGDPLGLAEARGDTYADFVTAIVSTPSQGLVHTAIDPVNGLEMWQPGDQEQILSPIWRLWQSGTRHHFAWACPHCGEYFVPMFRHLAWPKGATPSQARRDAWLVCPSAGCIIRDDEKAGMIAGGVQIAPGQTIEEAREGVNEPESDTWSCWTSGLCSPFQSFGDRAARYLTALATGETDKIQTAINAGFGECYDPAQDVDAPSHERLLKENRLPYRRGDIPAGGLRLFMAVDVQGYSLYYGIRAFGARGTSWLVDHGQLYGPTAGDDVWTALADLMLTPIAGMHIERVLIDSGFRPGKKETVPEHKVYEFARRYSWLVTPTKGKDTAPQPYRVSKIEVKQDGKKVPYSLSLAWLSTDFFKSLVMSRINTPPGVPGAFYLHADADEDYAKQVTAEVRVIENGKPVWKQRQRDNHYLDCFDPETELLTKAGWVRVTDLDEGMEFATVNLATDALEYQRPNALIAREHRGDMVRISGRSVDALVTPNHRMVTEYKWRGGVEVVQAKDLTIWHGLKRGATWNGESPEVRHFPADTRAGCRPQDALSIDMGDWAEFLGWYVSEGNLKTTGAYRGVVISQNPGEKADRIAALLQRMGVDYRLCGGRQFVIPSRQIWLAVLGCYEPGGVPSCYRKRVPDEIKAAKPEHIRRFIDAAILGDGWVQGKFRTYVTVSSFLADDMQELFIKSGSSANVRVRSVPDCNITGRAYPSVDQFHVSEIKTNYSTLRRSDNSPLFETVQYEGMVYCVSVPNTTLIMRRGGKAMVVGNCEAMLAAAGYTANVQRIPEGVSRPGADDGEDHDQEQAGADAPADDLPARRRATPGRAEAPPSPSPPKGGAGGGGGTRNRFARLGSRLNR